MSSEPQEFDIPLSTGAGLSESPFEKIPAPVTLDVGELEGDPALAFRRTLGHVRDRRDRAHDQRRRAGPRDDGERVHVGVPGTAARPGLDRPPRPDARHAPRGLAARRVGALREPATRVGLLRAPPRRGLRADLHAGRRHPTGRRSPRPARRPRRPLVLGRRPLALPRAGQPRARRDRCAAPLPRRELRAARLRVQGALGASRGAPPPAARERRGAELRARRADHAPRRGRRRAPRRPGGRRPGLAPRQADRPRRRARSSESSRC